MRTVLAVPADTHCGSTTGLLPPDWTGLGGHKITTSHGVVRKQWVEGWHRVRELNSRKTRLVIIHNGDAIDGVHHGTTQLVTTDIEEQKRMHIASMLEAMKIAKWNDGTDKLYYMMGTNSHTGNVEDAVARDFISTKGRPLVSAVIEPTAGGKYKDGRYVRDHMMLEINGVLFDIGHHGFTAGTREWTKTNTLTYTIKSIYMSCLENATRMPRYVVASHMHQFVTGRHDGKHGTIEGFITPALQTKTHHGHAVARFKMADIGMLFFIIEENGDSRWECPMASHEDVEVEKI